MSGRQDALISSVIAVSIFVLVWGIFNATWPPDLSALYFAARSYGLGQTELIYLAPEVFYGSPASPEWQTMVAEMGHPEAYVLPYVYAPLWAVALSPLAVWLDPMPFFQATLVVQLGLFLLSIRLAHQIAGPRAGPLWTWFAGIGVVALITTPFLTAFWHNQPQMTVTFLVLLAFARYRAGAWRTAGIALGVAAAIKITPAILALIFVMDWQWRTVGLALATGLGLLLVSLAAAGLPLHLAFLEQLDRAAGNVVITSVNFGLEGVVTRWGQVLSEGFQPLPDGQSEIVVTQQELIGVTVTLLMLAAMVVIWRGTLHSADAVLLRLVGVWSLVILCGPIAWNHYLIGPLLIAPGLARLMKLHLAAPVFGLCVLALSFPVHRLLGDADPVWVMSLGAAVLLFLIGMSTGLGLRARPAR